MVANPPEPTKEDSVLNLMAKMRFYLFLYAARRSTAQR